MTWGFPAALKGLTLLGEKEPTGGEIEFLTEMTDRYGGYFFEYENMRTTNAVTNSLYILTSQNRGVSFDGVGDFASRYQNHNMATSVNTDTDNLGDLGFLLNDALPPDSSDPGIGISGWGFLSNPFQVTCDQFCETEGINLANVAPNDVKAKTIRHLGAAAYKNTTPYNSIAVVSRTGATVKNLSAGSVFRLWGLRR